MKKLTYIVLLLLTINSFSQEQNTKTNNRIGIELGGGLFFSNYRYYKNYNGLESINLGVFKNISKHFGIKIDQTYGRMFNEKINNRAFVLTSTLNIYATFFSNKKINIRLLAGGGLLQIHTKCLYDSYPVTEHIYGSNIKANIAVIYKVTNNIHLNINYDYNYGFINTTDNYIPDDYYYKTVFYSFNLGVIYLF